MRYLAVLLCVFANFAVAAPDTSKRPALRPGTAPVAVELDVTGALRQPIRSEAAETATDRGRGMRLSLRPFLRSLKVERVGREKKKLMARGAVCGDVAIQGEAIGRVAGRIGGCGVESAVKIRSVAGIKLSQQAVMDCKTAKALKTWIDRSAKPALARKGGGLSSIKVAAHYACRTRNNKKGAKISEHGKGRAIDISAFRLKDGSNVTVLKGWGARSNKKALRKIHKGACGPFGTVLGPNADKYHRDHFHFDTARYRSGSYCR